MRKLRPSDGQRAQHCLGPGPSFLGLDLPLDLRGRAWLLRDRSGGKLVCMTEVVPGLVPKLG